MSSCSRCAKSFSFFNGEKACANCGFSFCSKCLPHKAVVKAKAKVNVCAKCHAMIEKQTNGQG